MINPVVSKKEGKGIHIPTCERGLRLNTEESLKYSETKLEKIRMSKNMGK